MRKQRLPEANWLLYAAVWIWIAAPGTARSQFAQNKAETIHPDTSAYPPDIRRDYQLFRVKCNECHGLDLSFKSDNTPERWPVVIKHMRAMASSRISDEQATAITKFIEYDHAHRTPVAKPAASAPAGETATSGRAFYTSQGCDACHTLGGQGGQIGPALDDVGSRVSRESLVNRMRDRRAGTAMPPLPSDTTDLQINQLVDFLMTLKGK